jgi:NAD(P)-dependent dehydrogenase (short-subunit alcohol dehydrogenase family)
MPQSKRKDTDMKRPLREPEQSQPGKEHKMKNKPVFILDEYKGSDKLKGKVALITGGDSGIGRATAVHFAREGADVCIAYLSEEKDADDTRQLIEAEGAGCLLAKGDVGDAAFCRWLVDEVISQFGKLDILVNNAAEQHVAEKIEDIDDEQLQATFRTNVFGYFYMMQAAMPKMAREGRIINTSSVTGHRGSSHLIDYASTKGAIEALTRSLAPLAIKQGITVNCVAPGPIWTPLIPASFAAKKLESFGADTLMQRPGQPWEVATCFVFLASRDSSYMTGQTLHVNGGGYLHG